MAEDAVRGHEIDDAVRKATSHWSKAGIPRSSRRRKADELRDHLQSAVSDGRDVHDVVGTDVVAFASEWAQADRERNWVEPVLFLVSNLTLWVGLLALLGPLIEDRDSFGMPVSVALTIQLGMLFLFAIWLVRWFRAQVTERVAVVLYGLVATLWFVAVLAVIHSISRFDRDLEISPVVVMALVTVGLSCQALSTWMKRTDRF